MKYSFGFIGCGNMGGTLAAAVAKTVGGAAVAVYDRDESKSNALRETYGVSVLDGTALVKACKFVVLGVKPQVMENALAELKNALAENENVTLITMAAGLSISAIRAMAGGEYPVIRIMPNTPCALGKGVVLYATDGVLQCDEQAFLQAFAGAGYLDKVSESDVDGAGALSGCGPAFAYVFAQSLAEGAAACGIPMEKAIVYAAKTLIGAGEMILEKGDPEQLTKNVCSPGGTTLAGVKALDDGNFRAVAKSAVTAAYDRTLELKGAK